MKAYHFFYLAPLIALLLGACQRSASSPALPAPQILIGDATLTPTPFQADHNPSAATRQPSATPTSDPYASLSIQNLAARSYGGDLFALQELGAATNFSRRLISYTSDDLYINGFMDVPHGKGPFPVVLVLHGYVDPEDYLVEAYTARYAAAYANAGYIAIHPNYRNYPPSDFGPNDFRVGFAIDVLNLIAIVHQTAGQPGPLEKADGENVFLWGHSMGGGIIQRVLTVGAEVNAAVLYGSMSGDERRNFELIRDVLSDGQRGLEELQVSEDALANISPINFYSRIRVPVSIHHGDMDDVVPVQWSQELCDTLSELGKEVECFFYHNMPHTFYGLNDGLFLQRTLEFFQRNLQE